MIKSNARISGIVIMLIAIILGADVYAQNQVITRPQRTRQTATQSNSSETRYQKDLEEGELLIEQEKYKEAKKHFKIMQVKYAKHKTEIAAWIELCDTFIAEQQGELQEPEMPIQTVDSTVYIESKPQIRRPTDYLYLSEESLYCDGVYHGPDWEYDYTQSAFYVNLGDNLNRDIFEISFSFYINHEVGHISNMNLITLSTDYREFGLEISNDRIYVTTDNQNRNFSTEILVEYDRYNLINLIYDNGYLQINEEIIYIGKLDKAGDNILSSVNFSNGKCFKGWLDNIVVKSQY